MKKKEFNRKIGAKLKNIREKLGMTLVQVSELMGFSNYQTLSNIEFGKRSITAQELSSIVRIYSLDIGSILLNKKREPVTVLWRNKSETSKAKQKEQEFLKMCKDYDLLEKKCELEADKVYERIGFEPRDLTYENAKETAKKIVRDHGFGDMPSYLIEKILEEKMGIKIIYLDLGEIGSAASTKGEFGAAILVNRTEAPWRIKFNIAHELFHIITWDIVEKEKIQCKDDGGSLIEKLANCFASSLLLPQKPVIEEVSKRIKENEISFSDCIYIARKFGVSTEAFLWRLVDLRLCDPDEIKKSLQEGIIKSLDKEKRRDDWRSAEFPIISDRYVYLAIKCLGKGLISKGKLAELLRIERAALPEFLEASGYIEEGERDIGCIVSSRH